MSEKDVEPDIIPLLSWDGQMPEKNLSRCSMKGVQEKYQLVVDWYLRRKNSKRIMAQLLGILSIILLTFAVAGLMITTINAGVPWVKWVGMASTILMVLAGGLVMFDRFFGYSSSRIRFVLTAMALQKHLKRFQTDMNYLLMDSDLDDSERIKRRESRKPMIICIRGCRARPGNGRRISAAIWIGPFQNWRTSWV